MTESECGTVKNEFVLNVYKFIYFPTNSELQSNPITPHKMDFVVTQHSYGEEILVFHDIWPNFV